MRNFSSLVPDGALTTVTGGEHDDEGLSVEGVSPTGLTAVIVGVAFNHGHRLLPGEERYYLATSVLLWCCVLFPSISVGFWSLGHIHYISASSQVESLPVKLYF